MPQQLPGAAVARGNMLEDTNIGYQVTLPTLQPHLISDFCRCRHGCAAALCTRDVARRLCATACVCTESQQGCSRKQANRLRPSDARCCERRVGSRARGSAQKARAQRHQLLWQSRVAGMALEPGQHAISSTQRGADQTRQLTEQGRKAALLSSQIRPKSVSLQPSLRRLWM